MNFSGWQQNKRQFLKLLAGAGCAILNVLYSTRSMSGTPERQSRTHRAADRLMADMRADFSKGRIRIVDGWCVSETELKADGDLV